MAVSRSIFNRVDDSTGTIEMEIGFPKIVGNDGSYSSLGSEGVWE